MTVPAPGAIGRCPCGTGLIFDECCRPAVTDDRPAPTAEALMRSRFTAFALGLADYLSASWHPSTRPAELNLDPTLTWYRLDIESRSGGSPFDTEGQVAFAAHYRDDSGARGVLREHSRFLRVEGRWLYVDGVLTTD